MEQLYDVWFADSCVGQVRVWQEGLYYCFACLIHIPNAATCRLVAHGESTDHDLGICVPQENGFGMKTRIPIKRFLDKIVAFEVINQESDREKIFVPIRVDKPFAHLQQLEKARLSVHDGVIGLLLSD